MVYTYDTSDNISSDYDPDKGDDLSCSSRVNNYESDNSMASPNTDSNPYLKDRVLLAGCSQSPNSSHVQFNGLNNCTETQTLSFNSIDFAGNTNSSVKNQIRSNDCLLCLGGNVFSFVHVVSPDEFVNRSQSAKPNSSRSSKSAQTYRSRQRKNYDSQSKHKILQLYDHYIHSSKRMTVRNIAIAIFKDLKKENSNFAYDEKNIVTLLYNHRQKRR